MTRLLHDRYYSYAAEHVWDLATGDTVRMGDIDVNESDEPAPAPLIEALDHGREGEPRWLVADTSAGPRSSVVARRAAAAARVRGFVPIAADVYLRLRDALKEELQHRALLLIVHPGTAVDVGRVALVEAAARWPRPHVLLTFTSSRLHGLDGGHSLVREARALYGSRPARPAVSPVLSDDVLRHVARGARAAEFSHSGRHAAAERLLRDVASALIRRQALVPAAQALISLGRLTLERGRAVHAETVFGEAAAHAQTAKDEPLSLTARIWQAAARTDAGQLTAGESLCRATLLANVLGVDERARAEATLARILIWQGRLEEAASVELRCSDVDHETVAFVTGTAVRVLLSSGDVFQAGQRVRELLDVAGSSTRPLARVLALAAHLRVLLAVGDLAVVEQRMRDLHRATQDARTPLRLTRMRLLLCEAYHRAGRIHDADRERAYLRRVQPVAPPLLRAAIDRVLRGVADPTARRLPQPPRRNLVTSIVAIAQEHEQDRDAVNRVIAFLAESLQASRLELCSADAGPATTVLSAGSGLVTQLGPRILEVGIAIGLRGEGPGGECGVPVRLGPRLLGALCARWPVDRTPPSQAGDVLELTAAIIAPRVDAMQSVARDVAIASTAIPELVGVSQAIADVRRAVTRAAAAPFAVLIEGESGVGKELVARAIHHLSPRRERRFCDLNCAALPDELLESELFGHARGAFTGAITERAGLVEDADGGTLFLDEVPDLSPRAQAKLLRVLQQQEVRRVGESFSRKVDVRIVSAVNRDMRVEAAAGRFRQDLLYRLDVIRIRVPPLRERPEDVPVLAQHFWQAAAPRVGTRAVLTHAAVTALARYHWPGNVRELQNVMAALAVAAPASGQVRPSLLPRVITGATVVTATRLAEARDQFERRFIEVALARTGGRRARAAREMGLSRQGLMKMLVRLGLDARAEPG
jgi:DNA-binding NtrC family response regulator